jgi:hypothetical protein
MKILGGAFKRLWGGVVAQLDETPPLAAERRDDAGPLNELGSFGRALSALRMGYRVTRAAWSDGVCLILVHATDYETYDLPLVNDEEDSEAAVLGPWIGRRTSDKRFEPWAIVHDDVLAHDWRLVA